VAKLWSAAPRRDLAYGGDDVKSFEAHIATSGPAWLAYDMRLMMSGIEAIGKQGADGEVDCLKAPSRSTFSQLRCLRAGGTGDRSFSSRSE